MTVTALAGAAKADWTAAMARHEQEGPTNGEGVLGLLRASAGYRAFDIDNLTHLLQTATRAERSGASDELVLAALLHDVAAPFALHDHAAVAAASVAAHHPPALVEIVRTHQEFQGRYYFQHFGGSVDLHLRHAGEPWYEQAVVFSDEWDQCSFDPRFRACPLEHFEPLVRQYFDVAWQQEPT